MITKNRLEELIQQGATIYIECWGKIKKLNLNDLECMEVEEDDVYYEVGDNLGRTTDLEHFFETKEQAEWYKEFGNITRTIKLDLPKWEDIEKDKKFHYIRHFVITKNFSFFIEIYKFTNTISVSWSGGCKKTDPRFDRNWELTKENYILDCRKCKELFLGGDNDTNKQ